VNETAERPMNLAEVHIRSAGYGGFSFRGRATEIGIKSASVHDHFLTKATTAAVARRYGDRFFTADARRQSETAEDAERFPARLSAVPLPRKFTIWPLRDALLADVAAPGCLLTGHGHASTSAQRSLSPV
jgi:hypothetical protein